MTLVGNDTGGAICQLVAARTRTGSARLVLTPCDAYENFLPPPFRPLASAAARPRLLTARAAAAAARAVRRSPLSAGWLTKRRRRRGRCGLDLAPLISDAGVRRDARSSLAGDRQGDTLGAAPRAAAFDRPVLIAWADGDRFFKRRFAERLAADIPGARLERIDDSYAFTPIDQPERTAELIVEHMRATPAAGSGAGERGGECLTRRCGATRAAGSPAR